MQSTSYAFLNPETGRFLRVYSTENEEDCITPYRMFTLDGDDPIYETGEAAAVVDIMRGRQNGRYLSNEGRSDWIPEMSKQLRQRNVTIADYVPVAFVRGFQPIIPGGDVVEVSMRVKLVRFENEADPQSLWLDDIENLQVNSSATNSM